MSGAISRTLKVCAPMGLAPRGMNAAAMPLVFPNANPGEILDYGVDFTDELLGGTDTTILNPQVTVQPAGSLAASDVVANGLVINFNLGGGIANSPYAITITGSFASPRVVQAFAEIFILPLPALTASQVTGDGILISNI